MTAPSSATQPAPIQRWLHRAYPDGIPDFHTVVVEGSAKVRLGRLPPLRVSARMSHRLGRDHVADIRMNIGRLPILKVMDAYVDGHGLAKIGPSASTGPDIDQAALLSTWGEAVLLPSAWCRLASVTFEPIDQASVRVVLPGRGGTAVAVLDFDNTSGLPAGFAADRYKGTTGRRVGWRGEYQDWRTIGGLPFPGRWLVSWSDEPSPWFDMTIERLHIDRPIDDVIERARQAIRHAGATRTTDLQRDDRG